MSAVVAILIVLAGADLMVSGFLLAVVWVEYRRQRRLARAAGEPAPPPATGQFLFLASFVIIGIIVLYMAAAFLLDG